MRNTLLSGILILGMLLLSFGAGAQETNQAPEINVNNQVATVGVELRFTVSVDDADEDQLTFTVPQRPVGMNVVDNGNDTFTFTWTPTANQTLNQVGVNTVMLSVTDSGGLTDTESFTVTVSNPPASPQTEQQRADALEDEFDDLEEQYVEFKRDYQRAQDENDRRDLRNAEDDLENLHDDLRNLQDDVEDLIDDVEDDTPDNWRDLRDDLNDLSDDVQRLRERISQLLHPEEEIAELAVILPTYTPAASPVVPQAAVASQLSTPPAVNVEKLNFAPGPSFTVVEEAAPVDAWTEARPFVWLGVGIVVVISLIIFLVAMLVV